MTSSDGEASAAKVPAPPRLLISDMKLPKGSAGGFTSQDQRWWGEGRWKRQWPFVAPTSLPHLPIACMLHHASFHCITTHLWSQIESQLWSCMKQHKEDLWEIFDWLSVLKVFYNISDFSFLKEQPVCSVSFPKKWQGLFPFFFWKCAVITVHYAAWNQSPTKQEGSSKKGEKGENSRHSLQRCPIPLFSSENSLVSVNLNLATNHRGNDVSKSADDWTARPGHSGDPEPLLALAWDTRLLSRSSISIQPAEPFDREVKRLDAEEGVQ